MSDLIKTLKQIALRKRDEKGEQGKRVSEKGFVEWKAADALEAKDNRIAELEADLIHLAILFKDYATAIGQNEQLRKENERQATLIRELNEHYGGQADEIERLTAVYEAAKDHVEWCRLNRGRGFSRLEQALAAVGEDSDG